MKEICLEETEAEKNHFNFQFESLNKEEDEILNKIYLSGTIKSVLSNIIEKYSEVESLTNEEDTEICKTIIVALKHDTADESTVIKLVQFLANRFIDRREEFNDRACIVASVLFNKDSFDIFSRKSIEIFENLLPKTLFPVNCKVKKEFTKKNFKEISDQNFSISHEDFNTNEYFYHPNLNPMFLQRALKILKEDASKEYLISVHSNFQSIVEMASNRVFKQFSHEIFDQLTDLTHFDLLEKQFTSLAFLMKRDIQFYNLALKKFCESRSEVMKTFLIFSFDLLESIVSIDMKIQIHLSFAEAFSSCNVEIEPSTREAAIAFVKKGIYLLKSSNAC